MFRGWWWNWLLEKMTSGGGGGGGGGGRRKMNMGIREGDSGVGGCGNKEKPCPILSTSTVRAHASCEITDKPPNSNQIASSPTPLDFFTQARKALSLRSPFDSEEAGPAAGTPGSSGRTAGSGSASASGDSSTILPSGLAQFLSRHSDSRKRHKRSHSGAEHKGRPEKSRGSNIWVETEEYFRELTVEDIDRLYQASSLGYSSTDKCFTIPVLDNVHNVDNVGSVCSMCTNVGDLDCGNVVKHEILNGAVVKEEGEWEEQEAVKEENEQHFMDVDSVGVNEVVKQEKEEDGSGAKEEKDRVPFNGLEWLLGSRSKIYLTSERPSKKRKLLGGDAGLEKILVAHPAEGSASLCHYCSTGDFGDQLNRLIVCSFCGMAVHQKCYGVQDDVNETWLCSWCKKKTDGQNVERPCLLCPKQGGALKPTQKRENDGSIMEYAHLFCCQWMPEVYIENTRTMEPIINTEGIKDTRRKLICYLCKVKFGACVRCSNGACRTSFHPICAREARHRMEIWGRLGCDEVELRAFCSKHSEIENNSSSQPTGDALLPVGSDSKHGPLTPSVNKLNKLKIGRKNGDKIAVTAETADLHLDTDKLNDSLSAEDRLVDNSNSKVQSECVDAIQSVSNDAVEKDSAEDSIASDSLNLCTLLKKFIDQGKIDLKDVAAEFGVSVDSLAPELNDNHVTPDFHGKMVKWLRDHGTFGNVQKTLKVKIKSLLSPKSEAHVGINVDSNAVTAAESDIPNVVPVKSVPPRRRTKSDIRIMKSDEVVCTPKEMMNDKVVADEVRSGLSNWEGSSTKESFDGAEKNVEEGLACQEPVANRCCKSEGEQSKPIGICLPGEDHSSEAAMSEQNIMLDPNGRNSKLSVVLNQIPDLITSEISGSGIHPLIQHKLRGMDDGYEFDGAGDRKVSQLGASSSSGVCCRHQCQQSTSADLILKFCGSNLEQLVKARNTGLLELSPTDEVEGELIYYQHRLLSIAFMRKRYIEDLVSRVVKSLQQEIDSARKQKWDAVLLSQYLYELREAKKQGRKERRHKEAQAVLAAATAAAAASSRISSLRKDVLEEPVQVEDPSKVNAASGRGAFYSQQNPRVKETLSRSAAARISSEKNSDPFYLSSDFSVEHPRTCDICRRCETILNPILVCSSCKVAVHLDCYRSVKNSTGPWYCELCEDLLSSRGSGTLTANSWEKPYFVAECGLCGGTAGAFRKSTDGQWIHAFCAEWVLELTFRRGQVNPIEGMETVAKGGDLCVICCRKQGVCIKCNYGNCQSTFHPSCARSTGFYMNVRSSGGKLQHKSYCAKHSLEQKAKAETQKHGVEEFKSLKQVRVELEKLRLLCERIVKREKLKRELVLSSHDILSSSRDTVVLSALTRHPVYHPDVSSDSATTSTRGYTDGNKSGSDTVQRSDDITVDSTIAGKRRIKVPVSMDNDQKTDDSSVSQHLVTQIPTERVSFSGKQIPNRSAVTSRNLSEDAEKRSRYRKSETFEKELVMTSDQASMKNQRLPKGFVYVPIRCLSKEKETVPDTCSGEPLDPDG